MQHILRLLVVLAALATGQIATAQPLELPELPITERGKKVGKDLENPGVLADAEKAIPVVLEALQILQSGEALPPNVPQPGEVLIDLGAAAVKPLISRIGKHPLAMEALASLANDPEILAKIPIKDVGQKIPLVQEEDRHTMARLLGQLASNRKKLAEARPFLEELSRDKDIHVVLGVLSTLNIRDAELEEKHFLPFLRKEAQKAERLDNEWMQVAANLLRLSPKEGFRVLDGALGTEREPYLLDALNFNMRETPPGILMLPMQPVMPRPDNALLTAWRKRLAADEDFGVRVTLARLLLALKDEKSAEHAVATLFQAIRFQGEQLPGNLVNVVQTLLESGELAKKFLVAGLRHRDARIRSTVAMIIGRSGWHDQLDTLRAVQQKKGETPSVIHAALQAEVEVYLHIRTNMQNPDEAAAARRLWNKLKAEARLEEILKTSAKTLRKSGDHAEQDFLLQLMSQIDADRSIDEMSALLSREKNNARRQQLFDQLFQLSMQP